MHSIILILIKNTIWMLVDVCYYSDRYAKLSYNFILVYVSHRSQHKPLILIAC